MDKGKWIDDLASWPLRVIMLIQMAFSMEALWKRICAWSRVRNWFFLF